MPVLQDLRDQARQAFDGAFGAAALAAQRFLDRSDDVFVGAPGGVGAAGSAVVDQAHRPCLR
ncbi:hypothetical protein AB0K68_35255 [Streptomyces sp. NPDC050698]